MSESIAYYEKPAARLRAMFLISIYLLIDPLPYARAQMSAISGHVDFIKNGYRNIVKWRERILLKTGFQAADSVCK